MADLGDAIQSIWSSDYVQKNPNKAYKVSYADEYAAVAAYINGGARPNPANFSKLGRGLVEAEDVRREIEAPEPEPEPPDPPPATRRLYGLHQDLGYFGGDPWWSDRISVAKQVGATVSRSSLLWDRTEQSQGNLDWSRPDGITQRLNAAGITPLWMLVGFPSWASGYSDRFAVPQDPAKFNSLVTHYANFCAKAAARYKGTMWEIGNEWNEKFMWKPNGQQVTAPNANQYIQMYNAARPAILKADPTAKVAVGGLVGLIYGCCISGKDFLTQMANAGCVIDYIGIHPYDGGPPLSDQSYDSNFTDVGRIKAHCDSLGYTNVRYWITEWGWSGSDETAIGGYIRTSLETIENTYTYVDVSTYFVDVDSPAYPAYGLANQSFQLKPRAQQFKNFMATV